jgi:soluble lytic murein transglycosylase-like protein
MRALIVIVALLASSAPAFAEMSSAEFFARDRSGNWSENHAQPVPSAPAARGEVQKIVARQAAQKLGPQWVDAALRIAKLESGFNCRATGPSTRHGRAKGVMQVMPASARGLGYNPSRLHECEYGVAAGISHMEMCIRHGVRTTQEMARCHVAGVGGWNKKLNRNAERYKQRYAAMITARRM